MQENQLTLAFAREILKHIRRNPGVTTQELRKKFANSEERGTITEANVSEVVNFLYRDTKVIENRGGRAMGAQWHIADTDVDAKSEVEGEPLSQVQHNKTTRKQRHKFTALNLAIGSTTGQEVDNATLIERAKVFEGYLSETE